MLVDTQPRCVIAIGASAGGVEALSQLVGGLPADLPAAVLVVLHVTPTETSALPSILSRAGPLAAAHARGGEPLSAGTVLVAPPDRHLLVRDRTVEVLRGPRENGVRPAIDPLFRTVALSYGRRAIGVVLSGTRSDGAAGAEAISLMGGTVLVQDPEEARFPSMPLNAIAQDHPARVLPVRELGAAIVGLAEQSPGPSDDDPAEGDGRDGVTLEASYAALDAAAVQREQTPGDLTAFSCPDCGGALWECDEPGMPRYRCRVGHAFAAELVAEEQSDAIDQALWTALRALLDRAQLSDRIVRRIRTMNGSERSAERFEAESREAHAQAAVIRRVLLDRNASPSAS